MSNTRPVNEVLPTKRVAKTDSHNLEAQAMKNCMNLSIALLYYTGFWTVPQGTEEPSGALQVWRRLFPLVQGARMVYGIAAQVNNIYLEADSFSRVLEHLLILLIEIKVMLCLYILIFRHNEIECVVRYLRQKQKEVDLEETAEQHRIVKQTNWVTHFLTVLGLAVFGTALSIVAVILIFDGLQRREIPFRKWFPYDTTHTPIFEVTLFTVMVTQTADMTIIVLFDGLFIAVYVQIIEAVGSLLETSIQYQVFGNAVSCLMVTYILELTLKFDAKVAVMSGVLIANLLEFFVFCVLGTILEDYSSKLSLSAFSGNWIGMSRRVKTSLQIVMARTMRGVVFRAFAIFPVKVETFVSVLKFSYSVYAVLAVTLGHKDIQARALL